MPPLLTLNAANCSIGNSRVSVAIQRHPDRETTWCVVANDLNAGNRLAPGPMPNGLQTLPSEFAVSQSNSFPIRHVCIRAKNDRRSRVVATAKFWSAAAGGNRRPTRAQFPMQVPDQQQYGCHPTAHEKRKPPPGGKRGFLGEAGDLRATRFLGKSADFGKGSKEKCVEGLGRPANAGADRPATSTGQILLESAPSVAHICGMVENSPLSHA
jgi:hypothetical protein